MTLARAVHERYGATFTEVGNRTVVRDYGRPERTHHAVRRVVGVTEATYGVVVLTGDDRVDFVDNAVTNTVPRTDGAGCYALLLDPQGHIRFDLYVYNAGDQLLVFTPPGEAPTLAEEWGDLTFVQDVEIHDATPDFAVFGVHGPKATEKVASVLNNAQSPETPLRFVRGHMRDDGVTVIRTDNPAGEESFEVVCSADAAPAVFDTLVNYGLNATPFGSTTWNTLTLEAGTPRFETELRESIPNVAGVRNALDFEKGCFVGQEVVSRVENTGRPSRRLVGLRPGALPEPGATVVADDESVGTITRAAVCPTLEAPAALARVDYALDAETSLTIDPDADDIPAERVALPFVDGSARSARIPAYPN
jgi:aminomethyltransferase